MAGKSLAGPKGNRTVWAVIQHADLATQEKYLPLLQASVNTGESNAVDLVYLETVYECERGKTAIRHASVL